LITTDELPDSPNRSGDHVLQENTTSTSSGELVNVPLTGADKVAYAFYATAATAALVGQVWAGVTHIPWPKEGFPVALRIAVVTPAVAVIELGGVATAALADLRRRKGEQAYAYRAMSLFAALVALVFNVIGHWRPEERFLAFGFGGLSAFAYVLWLIHSSARRRDVLRNSGQMATTGPVYGVIQWAREPKVTWLARSLALEHGYGLYESLRQAREQMRNAARRVAIAGTVAEYIRSEHQDERLAKIAETTYDPDRLAGMLEERINYEVVTAKLTRAISPPPEPRDEERSDLRAAVWVVEGSTPPAGQLTQADGGVPLRGADDRWSETMGGELTQAEYLPYDRSSEDADVVVEIEDDEPVAEIPEPVVSVQEPVVPVQAPVVPVRAATPVPAPVKPAAQQPAAKPAVKPAVQPVVKPAVQQPAAKPAAKPAARPVVRRPAVKPVEQPAVVIAEPEPVKEAPVTVTAVEPVKPEEPVVIAREVASRTRPAASTNRPAPRPARPAEPTVVRGSASESTDQMETDKKKMRAWALLSDWPADRKRDSATLASAIASTESYAAALIKRYDEEHTDRTLVASQRPQR
jgi:hypothetical protein